MKSLMIKKIQEEFGLRYIEGEKLERINFYNLCGYYKRLKRDKEKKEIKIIENRYYELLVANKKLDKENTIKEYKRLMVELGLEKNMIDVEYKFNFEHSDLTFLQIERENLK